MFLDPDPKARRQSGSGFFSSQRPVVSPRDGNSATWRKRLAPLGERSNNQQTQRANIPRYSVRLIESSSESSTGLGSDDDGDLAESKENRHDVQEYPAPEDAAKTSVLKAGFASSDSLNQEFDVSDVRLSANKARTPTIVDDENLLSSVSQNALPRSSYDGDSDTSGYNSYTSTLRDSAVGFDHKSLRTESRVSNATTLRSALASTDSAQRERIEIEDHPRQVYGPRLETLTEASPERSTVRIIATHPQSPSSNEQSPPENSDDTVIRVYAYSSDSAQDTGASPERTSSAGSLLGSHDLPGSPTPQQRRRRSAEQASESTSPATSSPNVITFSSESSHQRSRSFPLHATSSIDSIDSRIRYRAVVRPTTGRSVATSRSSRPATSDSLPPLQVPRKRVRYNDSAPGHSDEDSDMEDTMEHADVDTQPYPRQAFSMHLSTIASDSAPPSRRVSQHLSHFSTGSPVWTSDEIGSGPPSAMWLRNSHVSSGRSPISPPERAESSDIPSDVTMESFRVQSALPQPLFQARATSAPPSRSMDEARSRPLPPAPNSPQSDEGFDTVPELSWPQLHQQRSAYSLRKRSHSIPSGPSRPMSKGTVDSRWSQHDHIFPTWAKAYYVHGTPLLSSSQISLALPLDADRLQTSRSYSLNRDWSAQSMASSWVTSDAQSVTPASSRILPSIFRPWAKRESSGLSKKWRLGATRRSPEDDLRREDSRDSMAITPAPPPMSQRDASLPDEPSYGTLRDHESDPHRPLPRRYSKQRKWDEMQFPRPMSKDILDSYESEPHLRPSKRTNRSISTWRAPSFADSLDTFVRSKCNRQILLFALGFVFPLFWMLASALPLPERPVSLEDVEDAQQMARAMGGSKEDIRAVMLKYEAGDIERRIREERQWQKARWWRFLNRIMSVIGLLVIGAIVSFTRCTRAANLRFHSANVFY